MGDTIEVFTNTWSYSTIGLVYDPGRDYVRYAHESQSSSHNPTIYDVEYAPSGVTRTVLYSVALSTQNSGWPWQLDNRTGAGYDFVADTYFLPDYNGDLSYSDDNIVEVDADGNILNAWEMDDEVSSNDSSDGSEIDSIIDIAVVPGGAPGAPTRYFAAAAYDDNLVYEIVLTSTGTLWTPNSWRTVATCTVPGWKVTDDNLGIDYDAANERLYHSSWDTTTLVLTDLTCQNGQPMNLATDSGGTPIQPFDCPGAGGYNSGVTFIEGSSLPEVWVTDFSSDQTTRCEAPGGETPPASGWGKWIDGQRYDPDLPIERELADIIMVTDVITAVDPFTLTETWDPDRLTMVGLDIYPPVGQVVTSTGSLQVIGVAGPPEVVTVNKWFHVEPCTWTVTTLQEDLEIASVLTETRPVTIEKRAPDLGIDSFFDVTVFPSSIASFTLVYSNAGGFENDVWISNTFPITAPIVYAEPFPDDFGPDGTWARWDVGNLATDDQEEIDVYVFISETVPASSTVTIWDGIFDHLDVLRDETSIKYHVTETLPSIVWDKWIDGEPWRPGLTVTVETSQTFLVEEHIDPLGNPSGFSFIEEWNPEKLALWDWQVEPITYNTYVITTTGSWSLNVPPSVDHGPLNITKLFHVEPCTWTETILWESLATLDGVRNRPVLVNKRPPELHIDSFYDEPAGPDVYSREEVTFTLDYINTGGYESRASIVNVFPPEAPFVRSVPPPDVIEGEDVTVTWLITEGLGTDEGGTITVTVRTAPDLPPSTTIEIWDGIFNHVGELQDETFISYHVPEPTWDKWVNGIPWDWEMDLGETIETSDTITVTDVISTRSAVAILEHWNPEQLSLSRYITESTAPGIILSNTDSLFWEFPSGAPGVMTITKWFHVEPGELITQGVGGELVWADTILWEEMVVEDELWDRHPVFIDKFHPDLHLESEGGGEVYAGRPATFTLFYANYGGYENDAWITNTFPITAPFASASLTPTRVADDGTQVAWRLGDLETGEEGAIDVTVMISESLVASDTVEIWDGIFHDRTWLIMDTVIPYHVAQPPHTWTKLIDGVPWTENISFTVETSDTVEVVDVISTDGLFELIERWNPDELALVNWAFDPPLSDGDWFTGTGSFVWQVPPAGPGRPPVVTLTKWFHVEPCTWLTTTLEEELIVQHLPMDFRPARFDKLAPELALTREGGGDVYAGSVGLFTLVYSNTGGRENDVVITNTFPISAPLAWAVPDPDAVDPDGLWARWDLGDVDRDTRETIEVAVAISETLPPSTTFEVWDGIYNHVGDLISETWTTFHVVERPPITWYKWISDEAWYEGISFTVETADIFTVTDVISADRAFSLYEEWDVEHLDVLESWVDAGAGEVISDDGWLRWMVTPTISGLFTLTKIFHVEPCTWTETWLWEDLLVEDIPLESRPVRIEKWPPELWLESEGGGDVYAGDWATFTLIYSNTGGYENDVWIWNDFLPEVPFVSSEPPATISATNGITAAWDIGGLQNGDWGEIDVTVEISPDLPPSTTIGIWDGIFNHVGELADETVITYHVACKELTSVTLSYTNTGDIYTDTVVHFEADLAPDDATKPYSYTIDYGDGISDTNTSDADPLALDHTFDTTGTFTVEIAAWNCDMVEPVTDVITVPVQARVPCVDVSIDDMQSDSLVILGESMTFTATVSGDTPITYTWDFDDDGLPDRSGIGLDTVSHSYDAAGPYTVTLDVANECPSTDSSSIQVTVLAPPPQPEPAWDKAVAVNGVPTDTDGTITVWPSDTVQIVDRVYVTHTANVTFTLVETWTASLALTDHITETGEVTLGDHTLTWHATDVAPDTWHAITKTFTILSGTWQTDRVTESLWVAGADPQLADQVLTFEHGAEGPEVSIYLPLVMRNY